MTDVRVRIGGWADLPVEVLSWPAEADLRARLARVGVPRVLLVDADVDPPELLGIDEDWVRLPANDGDVLARAARLGRLASSMHTDEPFVDEHHILHRAGASVALSAAEAAIMSLLLGHRGAVVSFADFEREVWHGHAQSHDAMDAAIYRLRRRLSGLNLVIRSVRGRGFIIHLDEAG